MFALCIEASHKRGMGHLFRALILYEYLKGKEQVIILINQDPISIDILKRRKVSFLIVNYNDKISDWESRVIQENNIKVWINDKYESSIELCVHVKKNDIFLVAIDDVGTGTKMADVHFAGMLFCGPWQLYGKKVLSDSKYIILNPEIEKYRRLRADDKRILVTLGGSDTYGATIKIVQMLNLKDIKADVLIGPSFQHKEEVIPLLSGRGQLFQNLPSLIAKFYEYDWAVTGGGVTCMEACAAGLPCVIVANEWHEIYTGKYMESLGCAKFLGHYSELEDPDVIFIEDITRKSRIGMSMFVTNGAENIYNEIQNIVRKKY